VTWFDRDVAVSQVPEALFALFTLTLVLLFLPKVRQPSCSPCATPAQPSVLAAAVASILSSAGR
jgi:hypothetical protein